MNNVPEEIKTRLLAAADALFAEGIKKPTNEQVRKRAGGASLSHVSPVMREWKKNKKEEQETVQEMPNDLRNAIESSLSQIWKQASKLAEDSFEQYRQEAEEELTSVTAERNEAFHEISRIEKVNSELKKELETNNKKLSASSDKLNKTQSRLDLELGNLKQAEAKFIGQEQMTAHLKQELTEAKKVISELQNEILKLAQNIVK